ncbi:MAG TPA: TlpA disulfide reductase family protein [Prosthecobacter sp.]|nr:TlpA disulfide reductase family protein [Prosthecobacter sp.]
MKSILTLIAACCLGLTSVMAAEPAVGSALPNLGSLLPGAALPKTAGKVVLVDFWASWCAPCKASFPAMTRLQAKYASRGLVIIGIGVDEEAEKFQSFAARNKVNFTLVHDAKQKAAAFFNPPTMPTSYLVDRNGKIRYIHQGFRGAKTEAEYVKEIESLLGK